jgi:hypothetical protein
MAHSRKHRNQPPRSIKGEEEFLSLEVQQGPDYLTEPQTTASDTLCHTVY